MYPFQIQYFNFPMPGLMDHTPYLKLTVVVLQEEMGSSGTRVTYVKTTRTIITRTDAQTLSISLALVIETLIFTTVVRQ